MANAIATTNEQTVWDRALSAAKSTIVPEVYRGKPDNCAIAMNMADLMGVNVLMVMQNLYVVHGKPSWAAVFAIARWNGCGKYEPIRYRERGTPGSNGSGCIAYSKDIATGEELIGVEVTWEMANKEGWATKDGSKWKSMPQQMARYRAASFLIKAIDPGLLMGLSMSDEIEDSQGAPRQQAGRRPLKPVTIETQVVDDAPLNIEQKPEVPEAADTYQELTAAIGRAYLPEHMELLMSRYKAYDTTGWTRDQHEDFDFKWSQKSEQLTGAK